MRSLIVLEDWATSGHMAQRAIAWLLFWPLLLAMRLPVSFQRGSTLSVSDILRDSLARAMASRLRRRPVMEPKTGTFPKDRTDTMSGRDRQ
jgi:hypothetical protein